MLQRSTPPTNPLIRFLNQCGDWFNRKSPVLVHTPWARHFGNCAEEMYYGLLKARREGKKIIFLLPRVGLSAFRIRITNRELAALESEVCDTRYQRLVRPLAEWLLTAAIAVAVLVDLLGRRLVALGRVLGLASRPRQFIPNAFIPTIGASTLWQPPGADRFSWDAVEACGWDRQHRQFRPMTLAPEKLKRSEDRRIELGIPLQDWFVCLHVRETGFHGDRYDLRNASVLNYIPAIEAVTRAGGRVVRLGDASMVPLPPMEHVIDYAHAPSRSGLMDLYLISACRAFIGTGSGPLDVARLFGKRILATNMTEWLNCYPLRRGDFAILKHYFSRSRSRFLSLQELLEEPITCQGYGRSWDGDEYQTVENTPEEICTAVEEFMRSWSLPIHALQYTALQERFNRGREVQVRSWFEGTLFYDDPARDVAAKYRMASRALCCQGALTHTYVEENWAQDRLGGIPSAAAQG